MPARPYRPGPRLYVRFVAAVKAQGLEVSAVAAVLDVSRGHLHRVLIGERDGSAALWARLTPYLPHIDPLYVEKLKRLPEPERSMYLLGTWDIPERTGGGTTSARPARSRRSTSPRTAPKP